MVMVSIGYKLLRWVAGTHTGHTRDTRRHGSHKRTSHQPSRPTNARPPGDDPRAGMESWLPPDLIVLVANGPKQPLERSTRHTATDSCLNAPHQAGTYGTLKGALLDCVQTNQKEKPRC